MTDSLTGIHADQFEIISTGFNDGNGRPIYQVHTKLGANLAGMAGGLDLKIRRGDNQGGVSTITVPANTITPAPLAIANQTITTPENPPANTIIGQLSATGGTGVKVFGLGAGSNGAISVSPTGVISVAANVLGELAVPALWDFEAGTSFAAPVQVTDNTGTATATLTVILTNVNEAPSAGNLNVVVRAAQTGANSIITPLSIISDPDAGSTHSVTIFAGNTAGYFAISGSNLISTQAIPAGTSTILTIRIVDNGGLISFYTISIIVGSTLIESATYRVPQVTSAGSAIAVFPSTDSTGEPITYAFVGGDSSKFSLTGNILRVAIPLLRNVSATHVFQVQASTPNFTDTGEITIVVVGDPVISGPQEFSINEGLPAGTTVGNLTIDQAGDPNTQLSIIGTVQAHADLFQISPSGVITTTAVLVNDLPDEIIVDGTVINATPIDYLLFIRASNSNTTAAVSGGFVEFNLTVLVINVPVLLFPEQSLSIAFGAQVGDSIGVLDVDSGAPPYTFAESTPSSAIAVNASTGELTVQDAAPFIAAGQSLTVGITVTDSSDIPQVIARTITVNVSHALPTISGGPFNVNENSPIGTVVGQLAISKGGDSNASIELVSNGSGDLLFTVDNNGQITTTEELDYETRTSQNVTATITNSAGTEVWNFTISINNLPEFIFTAASSFVIPSTSLEVAGGTLIGPAKVLSTSIFNAATSGPSNAEVLFTIDSATDCKFKLNGVDTTTFTRANIIDGVVTFVAVTAATAANYIDSLNALNPSFTATVSDTRAGGLSSVTVTRSPVFTAEIITFNILDNGIIDDTELLAISVGDTPAQTTIQEWTISNGLFERVATPGTRVYSWSQAEINDGEIQLIRPNAETVTNITLRARGANLAQGALASDTVTATAFTFAAQSFSIAESPNYSYGTVIGNLVASGGSPPYAFVESTTSSAIDVNFSTGALTVQDAAQFDFETNPTLTIGVTASDSSSPAQSVTQTITVNVTNINEAPTAISFSPASPSFLSTIAAATAIATATATDPESTVGGTYSLSGALASLFAINPSTGAITRSSSGSLTVGAGQSLGVRFTDGGGLFVDATLSFTVTSGASAPVLTLAASSSSLADTVSTSSVRTMTTFSSTNPNAGTLTYAVSNTAFFSILGTTLRLNAGVTLDAVTSPTLTTDVTVDDGTGADDTKTFTLNLLPVSVSPNTATIFGPNCPRILVAANLNAVDKNSNPVTIAFTAMSSAIVKQVTGDATIALNTGIPLTAIRRGEYYILPTGAGTPSYTLSATTSRGTVTGSVAGITYTAATIDITTVGGSGVTNYATAETFFTSAPPTSGYTVNSTYYYSGTDGFLRATLQSNYGTNSWGAIFFSPISASAPGAVSSATNNANNISGGQYIFKESTRWRLYSLTGTYAGSRTWVEQTTA